MSIPGAGNPLLLGGAAGAYEIERSLRFNSADSAYLSRTPASAGNRKTWTWAGWVKRSRLSGNHAIFGEWNSSGTYGVACRFLSNDKIRLYDFAAVNAYWSVDTSAIFRDPSAWFHFVAVVDTTQATASNRVKLYVNGLQSTLEAVTYPSQNFDTLFNRAQETAIGRGGAWSNYYFPGYLADIHFIDGQALDPTSFGEFDTNGIWQPKAYTGTYGTNGFHLPFSDNSAATATTLGKDTSGNGNNWTPNNLTAGPATISNSWSALFDGSGDKLETPSITVGTSAFCFECWLFPTVTQGGTASIFVGDTNGSLQLSYYSTNGLGIASKGVAWQVAQTGAFPTVNQWNHVAFVRSGTGTNQTSIYLNGTRVANGTVTHNYVASSYEFSGTNAGGSEFQGYMSNARLTIGSSPYDATQTTITVPTSPLTSITNTSLLTLQSSTFVDNSPNAYTLTAVGNTRVDTSSPFEIPINTDSLVDSPTNYGTDTGAGGEVRGNYATLNPLDTGTATISNGNLQITYSGTTYYSTRGTVGLSSGKWYWEASVDPATVVDFSGFNAKPMLGIMKSNAALNNFVGADANGWSYNFDGVKITNGSGSAYGATYTGGDTIGVALDLDAGTLTFYKNGASQGQAFSSLTGTFFPALAGAKFNSGSSNVIWHFNAGQRPFAYTAPSGYKALCTANLPSTTITTSGSYTGNGVADGPFVYLNGVPTAMTVNGNAVTFGTHADKLSNGFKIRTTSTTYNQNASTYNYSITSTGDPFKTARAQSNP